MITVVDLVGGETYYMEGDYLGVTTMFLYHVCYDFRVAGVVGHVRCAGGVGTIVSALFGRVVCGIIYVVTVTGRVLASRGRLGLYFKAFSTSGTRPFPEVLVGGTGTKIGYYTTPTFGKVMTSVVRFFRSTLRFVHSRANNGRELVHVARGNFNGAGFYRASASWFVMAVA